MKIKLYITALLLFVIDLSVSAQNNGVASYSYTAGGSSAKRSTFAIDNNGNKWIGFNLGSGTSCQLVRYNGSSWWKVSTTVMSSQKVNALAVDAGNNVWVGTNNGIYVFQDTNMIVHYTRFANGLLSDTVASLTCGGGSTYAGTYRGLSVYNGSSFSNFNRSLNGMKSDTVLSVAYESSSVIWLGNNRGLDKFNGVNNFNFYNIVSGTDSVFCVYIDAQNNKWMGTNHSGVIKYDNNIFSTMQQLYGTPAGVNWPYRTYSISKGPNGGIFFANRNSVFNSLSLNYGTGCIEVINNTLKLYPGIAPSSLSGITLSYHKFEYDALSNKLFFININSALNNPFLYSFDALLYKTIPVDPSNSDYLDINNVQAMVSAGNEQGWDLQGTKYFVPKGSNSSPLKASALWIGGYNNGNLHMAGSTYRQNGMDFWPGPLDDNDTIDAATVQSFNKVWKVNKSDIANFIYNWNAGNVQSGTFIPPTSITTWPGFDYWSNAAGTLAPYFDYNSDGTYNYLDGDYPMIKGDQMIWWVYNDKAGAHTETNGAAMGIEVRGSAYAFMCPNIDDSNRVLNSTVFYNYKVFNFSANTYDSCYISPWIDSDLGNYQDDYIGCDVKGNYGFAFNGDGFDEDNSGLTGYQNNTPAFSCNILDGPIAEAGDGKDNNSDGFIDEANENCLMYSFLCYGNSNDPQIGTPSASFPLQWYNFMHGKWRNGTDMRYGGGGTGSTSAICRHLFPGLSDPAGISMGGSSPNPPIAPPFFNWTQKKANVLKNDMRLLIGIGPFTMKPFNVFNTSYDIDFALVFTQDSANCYLTGDTCVLTRLKQDNDHVRYWFKNNNYPSCVTTGIEEKAFESIDLKLYPNPTSNVVFIEFSKPEEKITVEVMDILGKVAIGGIYTDVQKYISLLVNDLNRGIYLIKIKAGNRTVTKKLIKE